MYRNKQYSQGFSLIETLAALTLFSIAATGIIVNLASSLGIQGNLVFRQRALLLAENLLSEILMDSELTEGEESGTFEDADSRFNWHYEVVEDAEIAQLYTLTVKVSWQDGAIEKDVSLNTLVHLEESL